jgi:hypothetical protein
MSSEHVGQLAWQFKRMSGSSGLKVQVAIEKDLPTPEWQACIASLLQGQRDERLSSRAPW